MPVQVLPDAPARASAERSAHLPLTDLHRERFAGFRVLMVPGLFGSEPAHWQSAWERRHPGFGRVHQDDWSAPDLDRWAARVIEAALDADEPVIIVAHSFGCLATVRAALLQSSLIAGALLVAPADPARFGVEGRLPQRTLEFPSTLVASSDDPWMPFESAQHWAERWGSELVKLDAAGHINVKSGYTKWPLGLELLERLCLNVRAKPPESRGLAALH